MQVLRLLSTLALAVGLVSAASNDSDRRLAGGNSACGAARVRKPWGSLTTNEQSLYVEALGRAIKSGVVKTFAEMHIETMGETQAHHSCAFFAWHRRMLLAFESYLRGLDDKFACLTIPYYDVHSAYADLANKKCKNMYDCSPIFKAIGGAASSNVVKSLVYSGKETSGLPVQSAPFNVDCDDGEKQCGAMLRNNLQKRSVPSGAGFGTFLEIVTRSEDYATFLEGIQFGIHNEVHNALGGVMATFASPRDVFFYSWHGAIDMYLSVFTQCQVGTLTVGSKESLLAFTQATQMCGGVSGVGVDTGITMNVMVDGQLVDAAQHPTLGKYFTQVGDKMWSYADTTQLGDYSYSYELPAMIKTQILSNRDICKGVDGGLITNVTAAPETATPPPSETVTPVSSETVAPISTETVEAASSSQPAKTDYDEDEEDDEVTGSDSSYPQTLTPRVAPSEVPGANSTTPVSPYDKPTPSKNAYGDDAQTPTVTPVKQDPTAPHSGIVVAPSSSAPPSAYGDVATHAPETPTAKATTGSYWEWVQATYNGLVKRFDGDMAVVAQQMRLMECLAFNNVFGVVEFSADFVANFHLASNKPVCGQKIEAVNSGAITVAVEQPATDFKREEVKFAAPEVIQAVKEEAASGAVAAAATATPLVDPAFAKAAETTLKERAADADVNTTDAPKETKAEAPASPKKDVAPPTKPAKKGKKGKKSCE